MADSLQLIVLPALEHFNMSDFDDDKKDLKKLEEFVKETRRCWQETLQVAIKFAES